MGVERARVLPQSALERALLLAEHAGHLAVSELPGLPVRGVVVHLDVRRHRPRVHGVAVGQPLAAVLHAVPERRVARIGLGPGQPERPDHLGGVPLRAGHGVHVGGRGLQAAAGGVEALAPAQREGAAVPGPFPGALLEALDEGAGAADEHERAQQRADGREHQPGHGHALAARARPFDLHQRDHPEHDADHRHHAQQPGHQRGHGEPVQRRPLRRGRQRVRRRGLVGVRGIRRRLHGTAPHGRTNVANGRANISRPRPPAVGGHR